MYIYIKSSIYYLSAYLAMFLVFIMIHSNRKNNNLMSIILLMNLIILLNLIFHPRRKQ